MTKVLHLIETDEPGGAETVLVEIADRCRDEYDSIGLVLKEGWTSEQLRARGIPVIHHPLRHPFDVGWVARMVRLIRRYNVGVIHSHEFTTNVYATAAARVAGVPIICVTHGKNYYPDRLYRRIACRLVARLADRFIAVSDDLAGFISARIGIPASGIMTLPNGIDTDRFTPSPREPGLRAVLGLEADDYVLIVVAALFEMKGHRDLLQAVGLLRDEMPDLRVLLVGDGSYRTSLEALVGELHIDDRVGFLGHRNDIPDLLRLSDLFVLPSYSEGMPISILEAMASGVPVVATNVGGVGEVITSGITGHLVAPGDPAALAGKIVECHRHPEAMAAMAENARASVVERFSMKTMMARYKALYRELLEAD